MTINPDVDGGKGVGVPPSGSGHSAEPEPSSTVSAVPASVPNAGDLRVWWLPQLGLGATFRVSVPDLQTASILLNTLARYDLFQLEHRVKPDYANAGGLEIYENGEWLDWESDDCDDFDTVRDDPELFASAIEARSDAAPQSDAAEGKSAVGDSRDAQC